MPTIGGRWEAARADVAETASEDYCYYTIFVSLVV
jgi:hypothetical protein